MKVTCREKVWKKKLQPKEQVGEEIIRCRLQMIGEERRNLILDRIKDPSTTDINQPLISKYLLRTFYSQGSIYDTISVLVELTALY